MIVVMTMLLAGCGGGSMLGTQKPTVAQSSILKLFTVIDKNGDNKVSHTETTDWLRRIHEENDANKDGLLGREEIPAVLVVGTRDAAAIVSSYDRDADQRLSREEIGVHANVMFQQDHNADGFLTAGEIKTVISTPGTPVVKSNPSGTIADGIK